MSLSQNNRHRNVISRTIDEIAAEAYRSGRDEALAEIRSAIFGKPKQRTAKATVAKPKAKAPTVKKASKAQNAARRQQGVYLGVMRHLKLKQRAQVKRRKAEKGYASAIALARQLSKVK